MPDFDKDYPVYDYTFTDANTSDYVVGIVVAQSGNSFYVLDLYREKDRCDRHTCDDIQNV